ncbi:MULTISPECIES: DegT/DnrJ/EryC1/StrS family aminotransferase [Streptomyces]|uniref:Uncharacterized protein n=1 Tax=Streptomyces dengpaensis TaxID=2049881 RepID=A0ABN5IC57_9ACTN|nr:MULTISPECIES: DegT/DnrJ/EryC1/StrS family aminotransferase [Streptomyces]AVH60668.1 hypothetical protein C4B68_38425 [Streptomyces dengpaensis]PIB03531.1 hypothetical protein B1C81_36660 [Streptomyces sp. HG99]
MEQRRCAPLVASLRDHGRPPGGASDHPQLGWNLRLSEFQSAILRVQLARLKDQLAAKAKGAAYLASELSSVPGLRPVPMPTDLDPRVTAHDRFSLAFTFGSEAFGSEGTGGVSVSVFRAAPRRAALRAEGIPVSRRDLVACPDEPIYADATSRDYSSSRTASAAQARAACARLVLLGQTAGSGLLFEESEELADVVRAVEKIHKNLRHLRREQRQLGQIRN